MNISENIKIFLYKNRYRLAIFLVTTIILVIIVGFVNYFVNDFKYKCEMVNAEKSRRKGINGDCIIEKCNSRKFLNPNSSINILTKPMLYQFTEDEKSLILVKLYADNTALFSKPNDDRPYYDYNDEHYFCYPNGTYIPAEGTESSDFVQNKINLAVTNKLTEPINLKLEVKFRVFNQQPNKERYDSGSNIYWVDKSFNTYSFDLNNSASSFELSQDITNTIFGIEHIKIINENNEVVNYDFDMTLKFNDTKMFYDTYKPYVTPVNNSCDKCEPKINATNYDEDCNITECKTNFILQDGKCVEKIGTTCVVNSTIYPNTSEGIINSNGECVPQTCNAGSTLNYNNTKCCVTTTGVGVGKYDENCKVQYCLSTYVPNLDYTGCVPTNVTTSGNDAFCGETRIGSTFEFTNTSSSTYLVSKYCDTTDNNTVKYLFDPEINTVDGISKCGDQVIDLDYDITNNPAKDSIDTVKCKNIFWAVTYAGPSSFPTLANDKKVDVDGQQYGPSKNTQNDNWFAYYSPIYNKSYMKYRASVGIKIGRKTDNGNEGYVYDGPPCIMGDKPWQKIIKEDLKFISVRKLLTELMGNNIMIVYLPISTRDPKKQSGDYGKWTLRKSNLDETFGTKFRTKTFNTLREAVEEFEKIKTPLD